MKQAHDLQKIENKLKKREQELQCLYRLGPVINSDGDVHEMLRDSTAHLIEGLQFPEVASASIFLDGVEYTARPIPKESVVESFSADITIDFKKRGSIEVYYQRKGSFLKEEELLVSEASRRIAKSIQRHDLQLQKETYLGRLEQLVEEKTRELERQKKKYEDLFMDSPVPLIISSKEGEVIKANPAFYRLLSHPEDGSVRLNFVGDQLYENHEARPAIFKKLDESGIYENYEVTLIDRLGNRIPVLASSVYVNYDGQPRIETVYKDIRVRKELERKLMEQMSLLEQKVQERTVDLENQKNLLTKRNQELITATEKLRESKTRLQALFRAITDRVTVIDADYNILMSNQKSIGNRGKCYKKVFGLEQPCEECLLTTVFREKAPVTREKMVEDEYYLVQAYPIYDSACNITGALEISRVITKEKNMERQLLQADKLASLGQLVSGVGHEINNPNTFIRGNLYIVQEAMKDIFPILDQHYKAHPELKIARLNYDIFRQNVPVLIEDMVTGANRIKGIVDGLKKFAKRDEGLLNEVVDLNAITEACLRLVDNQVRRTADVKEDFDPNLPTVIGNAQRLQQVIINIVINASQAMGDNRGTIRVITRFDDNDVVLRIQDDGKGMDEKTVRQIFDPFYTTKRHQGGTGLGLSIAYGIVKEHGGRIDVESKVGVGTTFCMYLPRNSVEKR